MTRYGKLLKPLNLKVKILPSFKGYSSKKFQEKYAKAEEPD